MHSRHGQPTEAATVTKAQLASIAFFRRRRPEGVALVT